MHHTEALPTGLTHVRTTAVFDEDSVPAGLLKTHRISAGVWGRLVVHTGTVSFVFEDANAQPVSVAEGDVMVIPPERPHHLTIVGPATFSIEFHKPQA